VSKKPKTLCLPCVALRRSGVFSVSSVAVFSMNYELRTMNSLRDHLRKLERSESPERSRRSLSRTSPKEIQTPLVRIAPNAQVPRAQGLKTRQFSTIFANFLKFLPIFANFLQFFTIFSPNLRIWLKNPSISHAHLVEIRVFFLSGLPNRCKLTPKFPVFF